MGHLWLRAEYKAPERRTPLIPAHARELIARGHTVTVEESAQRIFPLQAYRDAGCNIVPEGSWQQAPLDAYILGLKYLPEEATLSHKHIYFAHAYKQQAHASRLLSRFRKDGGLLYDLEYLVDNNNKRIAAFGFHAGVAGAALACMIWHQKTRGQLPPYSAPLTYSNTTLLAEIIKAQLANHPDKPSVLIIGALGRCGTGAVHFLKQVGLSPICWSSEHTIGKDISRDILNFNILLNCIYVDETTTPFLTKEQLAHNHALSLIMDVSCDPEHPCNPLPIYTNTTTFDNLTCRVANTEPPVDLVAIDNLPVFLPAESSEHFSNQLKSYLHALLDQRDTENVWARAAALYQQQIGKLT